MSGAYLDKADYDEIREEIRKQAELPEIEGRLKVVNLQPGDVLVLTHPGKLRQDTKAHLAASVRESFGIRCMVLEEGMELDVLRKDEPCPTS